MLQITDILSGLNVHVARAIRPFCSFPERAISDDEIAQILAATLEFGLVSRGEETGTGLWEGADDSSCLQVAIQALGILSEQNTSIAYHLHLLGLGLRLTRRFKMDSKDLAIPALQGGNALARGALAKLFGQRTLDQQDVDFLVQYFHGDPPHRISVQAAVHHWNSVWIPSFDPRRRQVSWRLHQRNALDSDCFQNSLGLEETRLWQIEIGPGSSHVFATGGIEAYLELFGLNMVGLMAIALGSTRSALARTRTYVTERRQGGRLLYEHPMVQLMLGKAVSNVGSVSALLDAIAQMPTTLAQVNSLVKIRAVVHSLLCEATTDLMQVFGGYGYMRDFGVERALRDNQHLKLAFGAPGDLRMFLGAQEAMP